MKIIIRFANSFNMCSVVEAEYYLFFFQAEDGIRDDLVTGVQTCALPISLAPAKNAYKVVADKKVDSVCPYCGVGCQVTYHVKDNAIVRVDGRDGPANHERLCVKGRFGFDYVQHPHRLTKPLIRKKGAAKSADFTVDPTRWRD